jgi:hypothetical protein
MPQAFPNERPARAPRVIGKARGRGQHPGILSEWTPILDVHPAAFRPDPLPGYVWLQLLTASAKSIASVSISGTTRPAARSPTRSSTSCGRLPLQARRSCSKRKEGPSQRAEGPPERGLDRA